MPANIKGMRVYPKPWKAGCLMRVLAVVLAAGWASNIITGDPFLIFVYSFWVLVFCVFVVVVLRLLYDVFWRRFSSLLHFDRYLEWREVVPNLESGNGTLLQVQGMHSWYLYWHAKRLSKDDAILDRVHDPDCFFTAQPIGLETSFVLRRRFPKIAIYCIRVDYRGIWT